MWRTAVSKNTTQRILTTLVGEKKREVTSDVEAIPRMKERATEERM
jgi:hypothetical protein